MAATAAADPPAAARAQGRLAVRFGRPTVFGVVAYVVLVLVAAAILVPIAYAVLGGFKTNGELAGDPASIIPKEWVTSNYTEVLFGANAATFWRQAFNSLVIAAIAVSITVAFASLAAFAFARIAFRGQEAVFTLFVFGLLFPSAVAILPLYILVRNLGLTG